MIKKLILTVSFIALLSTGINSAANADDKKKCFALKVAERSWKECFRGIIGGEAETIEKKKSEKQKTKKQLEKERLKAEKKAAKEERKSNLSKKKTEKARLKAEQNAALEEQKRIKAEKRAEKKRIKNEERTAAKLAAQEAKEERKALAAARKQARKADKEELERQIAEAKAAKKAACKKDPESEGCLKAFLKKLKNIGGTKIGEADVVETAEIKLSAEEEKAQRKALAAIKKHERKTERDKQKRLIAEAKMAKKAACKKDPESEGCLKAFLKKLKTIAGTKIGEAD